MSVNLLTAQGLVCIWQKNLATISENIIGLSNNIKSQQIKFRTTDLSHPYKGQTIEKAKDFLSLIDRLWHDYLMLSKVVDQAVVLAGQNTFLRSTDKEVKELLEGPSIQLPSVQIPVTQRALLDSSISTSSITPDELMKAMKESFTKAQEIFNLIGDSEKNVSTRAVVLLNEIESLKVLAKALYVDIHDVKIEDSIKDADADPIGYIADFDQIQNSLNAIRTQLALLEKQYKEVQIKLDDGFKMIADVKNINIRTQAAVEETKLKIANPRLISIPVETEAIASLESWLLTLSNTYQDGRWQSVKVGLDRWFVSCKERLNRAKELYTKSRIDLDDRDALRSQFKALKWRREILTDFSPSLTLVQLENDVVCALKEKPFKINSTQKLVSSYEEVLMLEIHHTK